MDDNRLSKTIQYSLSAFNAQLIISIVHPLDLIKTRLQSHDGQDVNNLVPKYKGMVDAAKVILKTEGIRGFGKGMMVSVLANAWTSALFFGMYESSKDVLKDNYSQFILMSSINASILTTLITQPLWVVKTRVILNTNQKINGYENSRQQIFELYNQYGVRGFYKGLSMSILLCSHGIIQMNFYEWFKRRGIQHLGLDQLSVVIPIFSGMLSKLCAIYITYPITTIRTRIQQNQYIDSIHPKYISVTDIVIKTFNNEGIRGFYKGVVPGLIRGVPSKGVFFLFYEYMKNLKLQF